MRAFTVLILISFSSAALADLNKCQTEHGTVYYTDKACSTKNHQDPVLGENDGQPAPPPPQKKKHHKKKPAN